MRLGVFGGTFDPVHNAHLFMAQLVLESAGLDKILFVPTSIVHHRHVPLMSAHHRAAMLRLAIAANTDFALDLCDTDEAATGYTADLLPRLGRRYQQDQLSFIAGADSLVRSSWRRLDEVLRQVDRFYVVMRGDVDERELVLAFEDFAPEERARIEIIPGPRLTASSTLIRERLHAGRSIRYLVPEPVWRYIEAHPQYARAVDEEVKTDTHA